jgi:hypothetical protein
MTTVPSAIIFVNSDINPPIKNKLIQQLLIDDSMSGQEFDSKMLVDPNYPQNVELNQLRILVIRDNLSDYTNREYADVVIFVKAGVASILANKYGPPGVTLDIERLNIYSLLANKNLPAGGPSSTLPRPIQDMLFDPNDPSHVHDANPDNIFNNQDFLNRK